MPASNSYYFFDGGFRKTNANRTFFLGVLEALGAAVSPGVGGMARGSSLTWFFSGLGEYAFGESLGDWMDNGSVSLPPASDQAEEPSTLETWLRLAIDAGRRALGLGESNDG